MANMCFLLRFYIKSYLYVSICVYITLDIMYRTFLDLAKYCAISCFPFVFFVVILFEMAILIKARTNLLRNYGLMCFNSLLSPRLA